MEPQEVFKIEKGVDQVTIIHQTKKLLEEQKPVSVAISGNIDSVTRWIEKRALDIHSESPVPNVNPINQLVSHILINREKMTITLVFNETSALDKGSIEGKLELHPDFEKWSINTGSEFDNKKLSEFIKMNRSCFESKVDAMKLSSELSSLKVKVDKEVEKSNDNRGNVRNMVAQQVIELNIPRAFKMKVPIFKGQPTVQFDVEIYVNPNTFGVSLVSPDANDIISTLRDSVIDTAKSEIQTMAPAIVIIEQ